MQGKEGLRGYYDEKTSKDGFYSFGTSLLSPIITTGSGSETGGKEGAPVVTVPAR
jgi:hypothetical protein